MKTSKYGKEARRGGAGGGGVGEWGIGRERGRDKWGRGRRGEKQEEGGGRRGTSLVYPARSDQGKPELPVGWLFSPQVAIAIRHIGKISGIQPWFGGPHCKFVPETLCSYVPTCYTYYAITHSLLPSAFPHPILFPGAIKKAKKQEWPGDKTSVPCVPLAFFQVDCKRDQGCGVVWVWGGWGEWGAGWSGGGGTGDVGSRGVGGLRRGSYQKGWGIPDFSGAQTSCWRKHTITCFL